MILKMKMNLVLMKIMRLNQKSRSKKRGLKRVRNEKRI